MLRTAWAAPLAWIYGLVVGIRHKLFDLKILRSEEFDIPIVCVGNLLQIYRNRRTLLYRIGINH